MHRLSWRLNKIRGGMMYFKLISLQKNLLISLIYFFTQSLNYNKKNINYFFKENRHGI